MRQMAPGPRFVAAMIRRTIPVCAAVASVALFSPPVWAQSNGEREFVGAINKSLAVRMKLSQGGNHLTGSYVYERVGKSLRLDGQIGDDGFTLSEFDER